MKKLVAVFALFMSMQSFANVINIALSDTEVAVGQSITVTLGLNSFEAFDTFAFDVDFDDSVFEFVDDSELSDLPNDGFDTFLDVAAIASGVGIGFFDFVGSQAGDFFVSFDVMAIATGSAAFSIEGAFFENVFDQIELRVDDTDTAGASVSDVPTPAMWSLFLLAGAGLLRRQKTS